MKAFQNLIAVFLAVIIFWRFQHDHRDVLEAQFSLGGKWEEIPGPYKVAPNRDGSWSYIVILPDNFSARFFRVRRELGRPNVGAELPDWNEKTYTP